VTGSFDKKTNMTGTRGSRAVLNSRHFEELVIGRSSQQDSHLQYTKCAVASVLLGLEEQGVGLTRSNAEEEKKLKVDGSRPTGEDCRPEKSKNKKTRLGEPRAGEREEDR
jgi:hypothetical protein